MELVNANTPDVNSSIRILHSLPKAPNVDVYANGNLIVKDLSFSSISNYLDLAPGTYEIQLYRAGFYDTPLVTQNIQLAPSANYTISIVTLGGKTTLFRLRDAGISTQPDISYLRFMNLSQTAPLLSLSLPNGTELFNEVEYLETTGYYATSPGIYNFEIIISGANVVSKNIKNLTLDGGKLYTIYIIGIFNGNPQLGYLFVEDLSSGFWGM